MPKPKSTDPRTRAVAVRLSSQEGAIFEALIRDLSNDGPKPKDSDVVRWLILREAERRKLVPAAPTTQTRGR